MSHKLSGQHFVQPICRQKHPYLLHDMPAGRAQSLIVIRIDNDMFHSSETSKNTPKRMTSPVLSSIKNSCKKDLFSSTT